MLLRPRKKKSRKKPQHSLRSSKKARRTNWKKGKRPHPRQRLRRRPSLKPSRNPRNNSSRSNHFAFPGFGLFDSFMKMIVGLGNPGPAYLKTRHNIGRLVVEALASDQSLRFQKKNTLEAVCA